jgi:hypothetical protein
MSFITELNQYHSAADQNKLSMDLRELVLRQHVAEHLRERHLLGVLNRHGDTAKEGAQKSQSAVFTAYKMHNNRELGVFVLPGSDGNVIGLATVDPTPRLRKLMIPSLPPRLVPKRWQQDRTDVANAGPEVCAWVAPGEGLEGGKVLAKAYQLLMRPDGPAQKYYERHADLVGESGLEAQKAWTIEPLASRSWVQSAIRASGIDKDPERGYFDDGESLRVSPPVSFLYIASNPESAIQ